MHSARMGNNSAFTAFEATVVAVYKSGKLDKKLLGDLMRPYADCDIDSGGKEGLSVKEDGLNLEVEDIVIKVMTGKVIIPPKLPKDYSKWTPEQELENENYHEQRDNAFNKITNKFGWC